MTSCSKHKVQPGGGQSEAVVPPAHDVPVTIEVPVRAAVPIIALGAELKNTVCLLDGPIARVSEAFGELGKVDSYRRFLTYAERLCREHHDTGYALAHDMHPVFLTTELARRCSANERIPVQHHHAHVASCMAENGVDGTIIGLSCDGTGYGADGAIWGCEVLICDYADFRRWAHLAYFPLPGGDTAAVETWRPALSLGRQTLGDDLPEHVQSLFAGIDSSALRIVEGMLARGFNCVETSSLGRLFDAVAFLTGLCMRNEQEGQAAVLLELAARDSEHQAPYPHRLLGNDGQYRIDLAPSLRCLCADLEANIPVEVVSRRFHETVADALAHAAIKASQETDIRSAALSGGCFFNRLLTDRITEKLVEGGFDRILRHRCISCGDAGLSLGQAVVAAARLERTS